MYSQNRVLSGIGLSRALLIVSLSLAILASAASAEYAVRVADINPGTSSSNPTGMTLFNGEIYFAADDGVHGSELMKFDGSTVTRLSDINTDGGSYLGSSKVQDLIAYNNELYFRAYDGNAAYLWKYDGSSASQVFDAATGSPIQMVNTASAMDENRMAVYNGKLYLEGWSSTGGGLPGSQLWEYDAATGNATRISDIHTGTWDRKNIIGSFGPEKLTVYNGKLYMQGYESSYDDANTQTGFVGTEIWSYDGTELERVSHFTGTYNPGDFYVHTDGKMYMSADMDGNSGSELVSFDGTNFTLESDTIPGEPGGGASEFVSYNGELFYSSSDSYQLFGDDPIADNQELWKFDGATASLVADINSTGFFPASFPQELTVFGGELFFRALNGNDQELWKYDGSSVTLVDDINSSGSSSPSDLIEFDGKLYFAADDGLGGRELFVLVPEPATMALLGLGGLAVLRRRRAA
jgi:ELWxxDGT repeat protein